MQLSPIIGLPAIPTWPAIKQLMVFGQSAEISEHANYLQAIKVKHHAQGVSFHVKSCFDHVKDESNINSPLLGNFNVDNLLAAMAVLLVEGFSLTEVAKAVSTITPIIGRMESFQADNLPTAIVDYAHTPDGLISALQASRQHCAGELWVVFGCGGDRDKGKRALMGTAAELNADHIVVTNDNPRTEPANDIVKDILLGCTTPEKVTVTLNREEAVMSTLALAKPEDMVLLAGKGHEDYIIIGNEKVPYNERQLVENVYINEALS